MGGNISMAIPQYKKPNRCMNDEEKTDFWNDFEKDINNRIELSDWQQGKLRIQEAKEQILSDDTMKDTYEKHYEYTNKLRNMNVEEITGEIQPRWGRRNGRLSDEDSELLFIGLMEWRLKGLDIAYFTSGAGSGYCQ